MKSNKKCLSFIVVFILFLLLSPLRLSAKNEQRDLREQSIATMRKAATFFRTEVASHGGYVYYYSVDFKQRWGEGEATTDQIWVQPPGTPTVGMAYLKAYEATGDKFYLDAATDAAEALIYGQLQSGGWSNCIDFDPNGSEIALYRNGKGHGKNNSSLDDGQTQSAIRLLVLADKAHGFEHKKIHKSTLFALDSVLAAQFLNGAFPQVWTGPVEKQPVIKASYPDYNWRTEGRIKNYWNMYTLNDNVPGYVTQTLINAYKVYRDEIYMEALKRLGDFLLLAQMPEPQPAWAQQYNYKMNPIWARKFEPAAISGDKSQEVMETLMEIYVATGQSKYLEPIPRALAYLNRSLLPDGRLARFYELKTNKPLYMFRRGDVYTLTYNDSNLPSHYAWKINSMLDDIEARYNRLKHNSSITTVSRTAEEMEQQVRRINENLDDHGRWLSIYRGGSFVGQPKFKSNTPYIASEVFSRNIETLSEYIMATQNN